MANKYLDLAGLQRLVNKIKELIPTRTSELDNDSGFITSAQAPVQSVNSKTGAVTLSKSDVGLGNVDNKSSATIRSEITSDNVTGALGYTPVNKAGDSITGDLKVNGDIVAGKELVVGYDGTTESLQRHKWKYNGSTGYLELWRYSNQNKWELSATFPNRNTGDGGLVVEGKQMATEDYVNNKVKTDVPANAKFTDTVYEHPSTHSADIIVDGTINKVFTAAEKTKLSGIEAGAEVNQNAFSNIKVGTTTIAADSKTDTLELTAGTGITLTPDATNDKVTVSVASAPKLTTARTISLSGDVSGSTSFDGSANVTITATVADDSHNHVISNIDGLQAALDAKETPSGAQTKADSALASAKNYTDAKVAGVVNSAPEALDTLYELAEALGNDPNFATTVMTEIGTKETPAGAQAKVDAHANLTNNPHSVTKSQVGLGSVQNYGIATQSQAEEGTSSTKYMTPLRTKQAIDALQAVKSVAGKTGTVTLTKGDVGLSNVDNTSDMDKPISTAVQTALDGKVDNSRVLTDVPANAKFTDTVYTLPVATSTVLGGVKSGTDITVDASGNVSINDDSHNHVISNIDGLQDALNACATTKNYNVTLNTTWSGSSAPFSKTQTVTGILATDTPIVDVIMSGTYATDEARQEAWSNIYRITTANNSITLYAKEKPTVNLPIQLKVVR